MKKVKERKLPSLIQGVAISPGVGIGSAYRIEAQFPSYYRVRISEKEVDTEVARFRKAVEKARRQYRRDKKKFAAVVGSDHSWIIEAHLLMLEDQTLLSQVEERIREQLDSPENALRQVADKLLEAYHSLDDGFFRERGSDFEEVIDRVIGNLTELSLAQQELNVAEDLILVAPSIGLSVLARFPLERVRGLVLSKLGKTSHVAIIARSFQIPVVCGIDYTSPEIRTGDLLIVDGGAGVVEVRNAEEPLSEVEERVRKSQRVPGLEKADLEPCYTLDGHRVFLYCNTEFASEVEPALRLGAEGIGLFRSEFLFMKQGGAHVDEEKHTAVYEGLARALGSRPGVVRTLDIAEETEISGGRHAGEEGAVLGLRGIRFSFKNPETFKAQVRAVLRARRSGDVRLVLPMISSLEELLEAKALIREVEGQLKASGVDVPGLPVGILLEVPAAILTLDSLAKEVDFLAVGTNDLIQYTLAVGRLNDEIAYLYNPLHPAILKSLQKVSEVARAYELPAFVCGEMAASPLYAAVLVGFGFQHLSMTAIALPQIKRTLRDSSYHELQKNVKRLLQFERLPEIEEFVHRAFAVSSGGKNSFH